MEFKADVFGPLVVEILSLDGNGGRLMPLAGGRCSSQQARDLIRSHGAEKLFPHGRAPEAAMAGLFLYFSCWDEAHQTAQDVGSVEGSYWHAIVHRQEPDAGNASYWFRRVGRHPIFAALREEAAEVMAAHPLAEVRMGSSWDPFAFIELCERAGRQRGSELETAAQEIQRLEWQLLLQHCAAPPA